jgi:hypothetical protein
MPSINKVIYINKEKGYLFKKQTIVYKKIYILKIISVYN